MRFVNAQRLVESKQAAAPWDEEQIRRVSMAFLEDQHEAEKVVAEWQLNQMEREHDRHDM